MAKSNGSLLWIQHIGLPKLEGMKVIMVVFDRITKYALFCALSHPFRASIVVATLVNIVQNLHGNPNIIVSDKDPIFTSKTWTKLFSYLGTQLAHSSFYHSQFDGKIVIMNKCLEGNIHFFASNKKT